MPYSSFFKTLSSEAWQRLEAYAALLSEWNGKNSCIRPPTIACIVSSFSSISTVSALSPGLQ